ncbi:TetR/AcrR family transcriptional regulator [Oceanobacillus sp. 1P07AA]|uniref:TetR/AcrR family transcriptional regulator n=1 Tax=Oceanobacillus sp. 1P07AA TaxID=3132293 RepID=UPI0039A65C6E
MNNSSTRSIIINAFLDLLNDTRFVKLTVKQIVDKTGISRSTFYLHFYDKYDLLEQVTEDITTKFLSHYQSNSQNQVKKIEFDLILNSTLNICLHILEFKSFYEEQFNNPKFIHLLSESLYNRLLNIYSYEGYAIFASYGTVGYLSKWVYEGCHRSPKQVAIELANIGTTNWARHTAQSF